MLSFEGLSGGYGQMNVLHNVSGEVGEGTVTAVLGANGAGKTTLMRSLAGQIFCTEGSILFSGERVELLTAYQRVELGLALVPEGRMIFSEMTVEENLRVGASSDRSRKEQAATLDQVYHLFPRLVERRKQLGGTLSGGEQQMLAIGRALMSKPRLILLDEPTLGLSPAMCSMVFDFVCQLRNEGTTILIAEQNVSRTLEIADRAIVIENGQVLKAGLADDISQDASVRSAFLG